MLSRYPLHRAIRRGYPEGKMSMSVKEEETVFKA